MHSFIGDGMDERDSLCLEVKTVALRAVEFVALDRTAYAVRMGTVHSQLVRTAGVRPEGDERRGKDPILRDGTFAMLEVDNLSRTI